MINYDLVHGTKFDFSTIGSDSARSPKAIIT